MAKITLSMPDWKPGNVAPATIDGLVMGAARDVPAIAQVLKTGNATVRYETIYALNYFSRNVRGVAPLLVAHRDDPSSTVRHQSLYGLGHQSVDAEVAVPELVQALGTTDRRAALQALRRLGPSASAAAEPLARLLADGSSRSDTLNALAAILPGDSDNAVAAVRKVAPTAIREIVTRRMRELGGRIELGSDGAVVAVDLSDRRITDADLKLLRHLPALERLQLARTRVSDVGVQYLVGCPKLLELILWNAQITDKGLAHLAAIPTLEKVGVGDNYITDDGLSQLAKLPRLSWLGLSDNKITDAGLAHLRSLKLKHLGIGGTQVTDEGLKQVARMRRLESLNLFRSEITSAGVGHLRPLTQLRQLQLQQSKVDAAAIDALAELDQLRDLNVRGTPLSREGLERFGRLMPSVRLTR